MQPCTVRDLKAKFGGDRAADRKVMDALDELVREAVVCQREGVFFTVRSGRKDKALLCNVVKLGKTFGTKLAGKAGILGGVIATLGVVFPSLVIITVLAGAIAQVSHLAWVRNAFAGINVCVGILIFNSVMKLLKKSVVSRSTLVIFLVVTLGAGFALLFCWGTIWRRRRDVAGIFLAPKA